MFSKSSWTLVQNSCQEGSTLSHHSQTLLPTVGNNVWLWCDNVLRLNLSAEQQDLAEGGPGGFALCDAVDGPHAVAQLGRQPLGFKGATIEDQGGCRWINDLIQPIAAYCGRLCVVNRHL